MIWFIERMISHETEMRRYSQLTGRLLDISVGDTINTLRVRHRSTTRVHTKLDISR